METGPPTTAPATPPDPPPLPPAGFLTTVFLKGDGLRAGWRFLLYGFFVAALRYSALILASQLSPQEDGFFSFRDQLLLEMGSFLVVFAAALIMARIEKRPVGTYGLPVRSAFKGLFWKGFLFGLLEISVVISLIAIWGGYSFGSLALHGGEIVRWSFSWIIFFLFVGLYEEFLFRGYTQFTLGEGIGYWPAAIALSISFGAIHLENPGENGAGVAGVMLAGLLWAFLLRRTGNLWFAVGMHAGFDFGETFLYSVPDSGLLLPGHLSNAVLHGPAWLTGGAPGPEASVFDFAMIIFFFFIFNRMYPAKPARTN